MHGPGTKSRRVLAFALVALAGLGTGCGADGGRNRAVDPAASEPPAVEARSARQRHPVSDETSSRPARVGKGGEKPSDLPGTYWQRKCAKFPATDAGFFDEPSWCVEFVRVTDDGHLEVGVSWQWTVTCRPMELPPSDGESGAYLVDPSGRRYDPIETRGAARFGGTVRDDWPLKAVLRFAEPEVAFSSLILRDDGHDLVIRGFELRDVRRSSVASDHAAVRDLHDVERLDFKISGLDVPWGSYVLSRTRDGFEGWSEESVEDRFGFNHRHRSSTRRREVSLSHAAVRRFLEALSVAPLIEGPYDPFVGGLHDNSHVSLELTLPDRTVKFYTLSVGVTGAPWAIEVGESTFVVPSDAVACALRQLLNSVEPTREWAPLVPAHDVFMEPSDTEVYRAANRRADFRIAVQSGDIEAVRRLLGAGEDPGAPFPTDRQTPLSVASRWGRVEVLRLLLERGADPEIETRWGSPLIFAIDHKQVEAVRLLLDAGADPDYCLPNEWSALELAAERDSAEIVELMLAAGASAYVQPALYRAAGNGSVEIVELLLRRGADPNLGLLESGRGTAVLASAVVADSIELVEMLLAAGADVSAGTPSSQCLLPFGAKSSAVLETLLRAGCDIDAQDEHGRTALMVKSQTKRDDSGESLEAVRRLLAAGADTEIEDNKGRTALDLAVEAGNEAIASLLRSLGSEGSRSR